MLSYHLCNHFNRTFEPEAFTRADIHLIRDSVQRFLAMYRQVSALWHFTEATWGLKQERYSRYHESIYQPVRYHSYAIACRCS